jgi:hypothetical protein
VRLARAAYRTARPAARVSAYCARARGAYQVGAVQARFSAGGLGVGGRVNQQPPPWPVASDGAPRYEVLGEIVAFQRNTARDLGGDVKHSPQSVPLPSKLPMQWKTHLPAAL